MNRMTTPLVRWSVSVACTAFLGPVAYADVAGHVQFVNGNVQLSNASGQSRPLQKGDAVSEGDTLTSASAASAQIRMQDGGMVAVRPETQLKFDQFVFNGKQDGTERSFFSLLKGGFRAITGLVGQLNKTNYRIVTPVATIGIRGTDHETFVIEPGSALAQVAAAGAYSKVNTGETEMSTDRGSVHVTPNRMGFAAGLNQQPLLQPINTKIFTVAQSPAPSSPGTKKEDKAADATSPAANTAESKAQAGEAQSPAETPTDSARNEEPAQANSSPTGNRTESASQTGDAAAGTSPTTAAATAVRSDTPPPSSAPGAAPLAEPSAPLLRTTAVVDNVAPNANLIPTTNTPVSPTTSPAQATLIAPPASTAPPPTTATVSGGSTVNLTTAATTTSTGQVIAITESLVAAQAQTAAADALAARNALSAARTAMVGSQSSLSALALDIAAATSAVDQSQTKTDAAQGLVNGLGTNAPADVALASSIATDTTALQTTAASQLSTATAKNSANGTFATSDANAALADATEFKGFLDAHAAKVQSAKTSAADAVNAWSAAKALASGDLTAANSKLSDANTNLSTAQTKKTAFDSTQSTALTSYSTLLAAVDSALGAAQAAAEQAATAAAQALSLQQSGDLVGAQEQLVIAQQARDTAQAKLTLAQGKRDLLATALSQAQTLASEGSTAAGLASSNASAASTAAVSASNAATLAGTKAADASTAMGLLNSEYATVQDKASVVAEKAPLAAYSHPRATTSVLGMTVMPVGSASFNAGQAKSAAPVAHTTVVLDGNGNLVEAQDLAFAVRAYQNGYTVGAPLASANVKYSGGTAADTFKLTDNSIYAGRWMGATVTVTDNANSISTSYTPAASLWSVIVPPAAGFVAALTGTTSYTPAADTVPVDAQGNLGTLHNATLSANFTALTVDAGVNLSMGAGSMVGTYQFSATGMPINTLGGFESGTAATHTTVCTTGSCSAGSSGYSSTLGGGLAGSAATSAGLLYQVWATPMYPTDPVGNAVQGLVAFSTSTAPTVVGIAVKAQTAADTALAASNAVSAARQAMVDSQSSLSALALDISAAYTDVGESQSKTDAAQTSFNGLGTSAPADVALASSIATDTTALQTTAASQLSTATAKNSANGTFATSDANAALADATEFKGFLDAHAAKVQSAKTSAADAVNAWSAAKALASGDLTAANSKLSDANTNLSTAQTKKTAFDSTQSTALTSYSTLLAAVDSALGAAQAAAEQAATAAAQALSLQQSGDLVGAQEQLVIAQQARDTAQAKLTLAQGKRDLLATALSQAQTLASEGSTAAGLASSNASAASTAAVSASNAATLAGTKAADASTAMGLLNSEYATVEYKASVVAEKGPLAAYSHPRATTSILGMTALPVGSASFNQGSASTTAGTYTDFVLDGDFNLVQASGLNYFEGSYDNQSGYPQYGTRVNFSGGTPADTFQLADHSIYAGRWMGATVEVRDTNATVISSTTPAASLWALIVPPAPDYVTTLTGTTTYNLAGNTTPVDALGTLGTLNSATLTANFATQTIDASVNFSMSAASSMQGTYALNAGAVPLDSCGQFNAPTVTVVCSSTGCTSGANGYSASLSGSLAGAQAASAGLNYKVWPSVSSGAMVSNAVQGLVAFTASTAPAMVPGEAYNSTALSLAVTDKSRFNSNVLLLPGHVTLDANNAPTKWFRYWEGLDEFAVTTVSSPYSSTPPAPLAGGLRYGSWDSTGGVSHAVTLTLRPDAPSRDSNSPLPVYLLGQQGYLDAAVNPGVQTGPLVGTFSYTPVLHISKDARSWADSTLTSASLSANFTTQTVDVALGGLTSGQYWSTSSNGNVLNFGNSGNGSGVQFRNDNAQVKVDTAPITGVTPVCTTCSAHIDGTFTGQNYAGAILNYALHRNDAQGLDVAGLVALDRMGVVANPVVANSVAAPTGFSVVATTWGIDQPYSLSVVLDGGSVLNTWAFDQHATGIEPASGSSAMGSVGTTGSGAIDWGTWADGSTWMRSESYTPGSNTLLWITAPEPTPVYLSQVLTGSVNYSLMGGKVTNAAGSEGTLVSANTFLTANFTQQTVGLSIKAQFSGHDWVASASNVPLKFLDHGTRNGFWADSQNPSLSPNHLTVTVDGQAASGNVAGQLAGANTDYAILKFNLEGTGTAGYTDHIQGVAGLGADTPNNANTAYRSMLMSITNPGSTSPATLVDGSYTADSRTTLSGVHAQTFDHGNSTIAFASGTPTGGSAVIDGATVAWGRWSAGSTVSTTDRASGTVVPYTLAGGAHIITGPLMTGPVALPTTGTYSYTMAGHTDPTDHTGVTGSLTSATLKANFTNQTVDVGVNVTVAGSTMGATASAIPILQRSHFQADSRPTGSNPLAVTCSGVCGTTNQASIAGGFTGANGKAAGMAYGFTREGVNAGAINGVVVFQRP